MQPISVYDVRAVSGDSSFLLDNGTTAILYDSGFAFSAPAVAERIRAVLKERPVDYIFLTHSHFDHALGVPYFCRLWPDVKVVAGSYAARSFSKLTARASMLEMDRVQAANNGVLSYEYDVDTLRVDISVEHGDVVRAGGLEFRVVSLPGHTKCSVGYFLEREGLLLSTETLGGFDGGEVIYPLCLVGYRMTLESMDLVSAMPVKRLLLPHYGLLDEEKTAFYLQNIKAVTVDMAEAMARIWKSGGTREDCLALYRERFCRGNVVYPEESLVLNTGIMAEMIKRELVDSV